MKYSHKKVGSVIEIFRDDTKVADYNPVDEKTTYVKKDYQKYEPEVLKVIAALTEEADTVDLPPADTNTDVSPTGDKSDDSGATPTERLTDAQLIKALESEKEVLEKRVKQLTRVNQDLEIQIKQMQTSSESITTTQPTPERFNDAVDITNAPEQDRQLGDLTPAFVKWAKKNWSPEIFEKRYRGRIKDLKNV